MVAKMENTIWQRRTQLNASLQLSVSHTKSAGGVRVAISLWKPVGILQTGQTFQSNQTIANFLKGWIVGVPATSRILTGDSQKLSFFNSNKSTLLDFLIRQTPRRYVGCMSISCASMGCALQWFTFSKSSRKIVRNINHPAKLDDFF